MRAAHGFGGRSCPRGRTGACRDSGPRACLCRCPSGGRPADAEACGGGPRGLAVPGGVGAAAGATRCDGNKGTGESTALRLKYVPIAVQARDCDGWMGTTAWDSNPHSLRMSRSGEELGLLRPLRPTGAASSPKFNWAESSPKLRSASRISRKGMGAGVGYRRRGSSDLSPTRDGGCASRRSPRVAGERRATRAVGRPRVLRGRRGSEGRGRRVSALSAVQGSARACGPGGLNVVKEGRGWETVGGNQPRGVGAAGRLQRYCCPSLRGCICFGRAASPVSRDRPGAREPAARPRPARGAEGSAGRLRAPHECYSPYHARSASTRLEDGRETRGAGGLLRRTRANRTVFIIFHGS